MPKYFKQHLLANKDSHSNPPESFDWEDELMYPSQLVETILSWKAPSRPFRKKDKSFYFTSTTIVVLISLIAGLAGWILLIAALLAMLFVVYVLNFIPPEDVEYKISTQGITIGEHFYHWQELDSFWFTKKEGGVVLLHIQTLLHFPGQLILLLDKSVDEENVKRVCARFLPFQEIAPQSFMEKWGAKLQKHFPLENMTSS